MPSPHPIDVHVGRRIRQRRILLGMSMENLGLAVGLTFQMIQKYEIGRHSVPVSRLVEVAKALDVPPSLFFEGRPRSSAKVPLYKRETLGSRLNQVHHRTIVAMATAAAKLAASLS